VDGGRAVLVQPLTVPRETIPGVNLVGFLEGELGLGEVARRLGRALERAGIPFAAISYRRTPSRQEHPLEFEPSREASFDTNLICLNADYLHALLADVGVDFFAHRYSIGVWFWESNVFRRQDLDGLRFLEEVWVASEYVRRAVAARADIPVHVFPLPVESPTAPTRSRSELGLPDGFVFLFLFDFVSAQRKNPGAVVDAFKRAFVPGEGVVLVLKSINGRERKPRLLEQLLAAAEGRPDIRIVDGYVSADEKEAMIAACDCYVSLHRSEGFGLTMAEAMAHGKPVIATGYSGNLEFMHGENSHLVPHRLVPIPEDWWAYSAGAEWAEPDVDSAAELMRRVYENQDAARALGERGRASILSAFSLERAAEFVSGRLSEARARHELAAHSSEYDARTPILRASAGLSEGVGDALASRAGRSPTSLVRRLLRRLLWPELARQHELDSAMLEALSALERSRHDELQRLRRLEDSLLRAGDEPAHESEEGR
jgi:glycosyltransferase involved in cell wall biosynthesis